MTSDFLALFRSHLLDWFEARLADGRTPFRRVEERPPLLAGVGAPADLVLWINRDSLLAGALILTPDKADADTLRRGAVTATTLGLKQFVTWEANAVRLWQVDTGEPGLLKGWQLPPGEKLTATHFAVAGDNLLQELKLSAITGSCPAAELPASHFASLCLLTLQGIAPVLTDAARVASGIGQSQELADTKGWLTLWRLLALLWQQRLPTGVAPDRLEQALAYALADLPGKHQPWLAVDSAEMPLPAAAATRFQHLAGRLTQLGWAENRERAAATAELLLDEATRRFGVSRRDSDLTTGGLLVNRLPLAPPTAVGGLVAPRPCLAGLILNSWLNGTALPATLSDEIARLPRGWQPDRVDAWLHESAPPRPAQRRRLLAALRQTWPYRRTSFSAAVPTWLWEALFLVGLAAPEGDLRIRLPAGWAVSPGVELFWRMRGELWALTGLHPEDDGGQTLTLTPVDRAPACLIVRSDESPGGSIELPTVDTPLALVAGLSRPGPACVAPMPAPRRDRSSLQSRIASRVFRDGLPRFPEDYLRRRDAVALSSYQLPGPLSHDTSFFGYCRLRGASGETLDVDSPITAEALILAGHAGRERVNLPIEPLVTAELIAAYRRDLQRLWLELLGECQRHLARQQQVRSMARQIWQRHRLPPVEAAP